MSYLSQMAGLAVHNFVSAATGIAIAIALVRGFARRSAQRNRQLLGRSHPGNRSISCLPICIVFTLVLVARGVPQNLNGYTAITRRWAAHRNCCRRGRSPRQEAIKMLGTNGGGILNANSAHPFENPTPLTNFVADAARSSPSPPG